MLFRYFAWRISMTAPEPICMLATAVVFDPLVSMVILSGKSCYDMACLRKRRAAASSR
jgi:hypothetical protein